MTPLAPTVIPVTTRIIGEEMTAVDVWPDEQGRLWIGVWGRANDRSTAAVLDLPAAEQLARALIQFLRGSQGKT